MNEEWKEDYEALPKAGSHRLIDFDEARVVTDRPPHFLRDIYLLVEGSRTRTCGWSSRRWCA